MAETWTVARLRSWMTPYLSERSVESAAVCADLLIAHVLSCERIALYMDPDRPASVDELAKLRGLVQRAGQHEPVQYLVGSWSFFGCEIEVGPCTLIPRPATESLVEEALRRVRGDALPPTTRRPICIVDLCTGSGCVAIAIARSLIAARGGRKQLAWKGQSATHDQDDASTQSGVRIYATEIVLEAVAMARRNVRSNGFDSVIEVLAGDLDAPLGGRGLEATVDVLCANPPYISDAEWAHAPRNVREYEPQSALRGGVDGLEFVRRILASASTWLKPDGTVLVEISSSQGTVAQVIAAEMGLREIQVLCDLEGHQRILAARRGA